MSGSNIVADTSLLIHFFNGIDLARKVMKGQQIWVSCITEIELLSYPKLTTDEERLLQSFLEQCNKVDLHRNLRQRAIQIRKRYNLKVPDAIIAATSIDLEFPLVTLDSDFKKIEELDSIILEL